MLLCLLQSKSMIIHQAAVDDAITVTPNLVKQRKGGKKRERKGKKKVITREEKYQAPCSCAVPSINSCLVLASRLQPKHISVTYQYLIISNRVSVSQLTHRIIIHKKWIKCKITMHSKFISADFLTKLKEHMQMIHSCIVIFDLLNDQWKIQTHKTKHTTRSFSLHLEETKVSRS